MRKESVKDQQKERLEESQGLIDTVELAIDYGLPVSQEAYEQYKQLKEETACLINLENSIPTRN